MERCCIHHVEFGVRNGKDILRRLISQFKFKLVATRNSPAAEQWVLRSERARFVVTELSQEVVNEGTFPFSTQTTVTDTDPFVCLWNTHLNNGKSNFSDYEIRDSVFNVAFEVKNIKSCLSRLTQERAEIVKPLKCLSDQKGEVWVATVRSCFGNVVHTLIQKDDYQGVFLPGFENLDQVPPSGNLGYGCNLIKLTHIDHVTFACDCGTSGGILQWYEECFGMKRFFINSSEDEHDGFVIKTNDVGLRLKVMEYWKCAEVGLTSAGSDRHSVKFVIAEALPDQGPNQIATFLKEHGGAGIQHIGLNSPDIITTITALKQNGVEFAEPPYTYYTEIGKLNEIQEIGQDVDMLQENGILVDAEADEEQSVFPDAGIPVKCRYLMQKFTRPVFNQDSFFLEIIQRVGATGFGSGNIIALWRSVKAYLSQKEKTTPDGPQ